MIRINLLESLPEGDNVQAALHPGGASAFITKKEVLLGGSFLLLGAVILGGLFLTQSGRDMLPGDDPAEEASASETPIVEPPTPPEPPPPAEPVAAAPAESATEPESPEPTQPAPMLTATVVSRSPARTERAAPEAPAPAEAATPPPSRNPQTWAAAARLTDLTVEPLGSQLRIFLSVKGECDVKTFNLDNPGRVVVDVEPARLAMRTRTFEVGHPLIQRIRVAQNQLDPPKVRLVMDAVDLPDMIIVDRSGGFEFMVTPDQ